MNLGRWIDKSALKAVAFGFIGMTLAIALYLAGAWAYARYQEFKFMRAVISQSVDASRQRLAAQPQAAPKPTPQPEGPKK